ncbi:MAG: DUF2784 domain-containing protein [Pseudomonadales bacterium]|nr:DUF2784 domain-containing protein [Pseudomonadales bacterium]MCP5348691.1 DUF2784 domain-containing protein [Pseudomonadales bacterium]
MSSKGLLADVVLLFHFLVVLFAVLGAFLVFPKPGATILHVLIVAWCSIVNLADWTCPLTPLEQYLRRSSGGTSYSGGCVYHYLDPLVRPLGMPIKLELIAGYSIVAWNLLVYSVLWAIR